MVFWFRRKKKSGYSQKMTSEEIKEHNEAIAQLEAEGAEEAKADYEKGILRTYIRGFVPTGTISRVLEEDYGVEALFSGCMGNSWFVGYANYMDARIKEKFGKDVFSIACAKADQLDREGKGDYLPGDNFPYHLSLSELREKVLKGEWPPPEK